MYGRSASFGICQTHQKYRKLGPYEDMWLAFGRNFVKVGSWQKKLEILEVLRMGLPIVVADFRRVFLAYLEAPNSILFKNQKI